jgi:hypothetical protein
MVELEWKEDCSITAITPWVVSGVSPVVALKLARFAEYLKGTS